MVYRKKKCKYKQNNRKSGDNMDKKSIHENQAIQDGLERFLDQELGSDMTPEPVQPQVQMKKELKTEFATEVIQSKPQPKPQPQLYTEEVYEEEWEEEWEDDEDETFEEEVYRGMRQKHPEARMQKHDRKSQAQRSSGKKRNVKKKSQDKKKKQEKKKKSKLVKVLIVFLAIFGIGLFAMYSLVGKVYHQMNYEKVSGLASEPMKQDGVINVLLIGNDSRNNGEDGRSDAMILVSVSNETKSIHMTSLLRDMYVEIPGHGGNRLNAAYAYGGAALLCETIEQNFGIEVNRYVLVNFQAFAALVDAVGGIDMDVTNEEVQWINAYLNEYNLLEGKELTTDYLDTSLSGEIHLNGPQALAYSRNRYIGTDFGRTERQRKVLSAVFKKLPIAFAANQDELIDGLFPHLTTNMTQAEVFRLSMDAGKIFTYEMKQTVIPAEGTYSNATIREMSVLEVDFEANKAIIQKEIYGKEDE